MTGLQALNEPEDAKVDIVFIHGLMGDKRKTWTKDGVTWPEELLKEDCPDARILTWGYNSKVADFWERPADNNIDSFSDAFFQRLQSDRSAHDATDRPVILVAHSLGGIVVANALVDSASNSYGDLGAAVKAVMFLGTPHRGSDLAKWGKVGERFAKYFSWTNDKLLPILDRPANNEKLAKIGDSFPKLLNTRGRDPATRIEVACFYEGQPTSAITGREGRWKSFFSLEKFTEVGVVVDKDSASLSGYDHFLLDSNHSEMCKFSEREDPNYKHVAGHLAKWCKDCAQLAKADARKGEPNKTAIFNGPNYGNQQFENSGTQTFNFGQFPQQPQPASVRRG